MKWASWDPLDYKNTPYKDGVVTAAVFHGSYVYLDFTCKGWTISPHMQLRGSFGSYHADLRQIKTVGILQQAII